MNLQKHNSQNRRLVILHINKDENAHRFALRVDLLERVREIERARGGRERETKRDKNHLPKIIPEKCGW